MLYAVQQRRGMVLVTGETSARFGLVVFHEERHLPGPRRREAALMCAAPMRLGLTAAPGRSDGREPFSPAPRRGAACFPW